jgi:hypothetical protein
MNQNQVRHAKGNKSAAQSKPQNLAPAGQGLSTPDTAPGVAEEIRIEIPLVPCYEFQRKHEALLDKCFSSDDWRLFSTAWTEKRCTEAYMDLGVNGTEEERRYINTIEALYDSPGFKALPRNVQMEVREFLGIEIKSPRRFGPSFVVHRRLDRARLREHFKEWARGFAASPLPRPFKNAPGVTYE